MQCFYKQMQHVVNSCSACQQKPWFTHMFVLRTCMPVHLTTACCFLTTASTSAFPLFPGQLWGHAAGIIPLAYLSGYIMPCLKSPPTYFSLQSDHYKHLSLASNAHQSFRFAYPSDLVCCLVCLSISAPVAYQSWHPVKFFVSAFCASSQSLSCKGYFFGMFFFPLMTS